MAKPKKHWSGGFSDLRLGCEREPGTRHGSVEHRTWSASMFVERATSAPDHYCVPCTNAARLALAAESAPKPDAVVWPKPRPISEAPKDTRILAWKIFPGKGLGWIVVSWDDYEAQWIDSNGVSCNVTHFLPLPPKVKK